MAHASLIQILKLNEPRKGETDGRKWVAQDAECIVLNDDGSVAEVAVMRLPRTADGSPLQLVPGLYSASFALQASKARDGGRRLEAVFTHFNPLPGDYFSKAGKAGGKA